MRDHFAGYRSSIQSYLLGNIYSYCIETRYSNKLICVSFKSFLLWFLYVIPHIHLLIFIINLDYNIDCAPAVYIHVCNTIYNWCY